MAHQLHAPQGNCVDIRHPAFRDDPSRREVVRVDQGDDLTQGYDNFMLSGAVQTWVETGAGAGSIVAVVDTGTAPNVCLQHALTGAPGFPDGYNATGDGIPANSILNVPHGTFVGGVIASACELGLYPAGPLYEAIHKYLPEFGTVIPILGQAPLAQIYPVKVIRTELPD